MRPTIIESLLLTELSPYLVELLQLTFSLSLAAAAVALVLLAPTAVAVRAQVDF
jgi:hypothetical protein